MRRFRAIAPARFAPGRALFGIAVIHQLCRFLRRPGPQVDRHQDLCPAVRRKACELIGSHFIGFQHIPCHFLSHGPFFLRADTVLPVVAGHEVAARIAYSRHSQLTDQLLDIIAEAVFIRRGMPRLIDSVVDTASQMLHKGAVHSPVYLSCRKISVV